jgi:hypothetical protein
LYDHIEVYLDESGDLGFSASSSRHFVVVALASSEPIELARLVKRIRQRRFPTRLKAMEFKFRSSPESVRRLFCCGIARTSAQIAWGGIYKPNTASAWQNDKSELYTHVCSRTLSELTRHLHTKSIHVVLDKWSSSRTVRRHLEAYLGETVRGSHMGYLAPSLEISHLDSVDSVGIQVADFVAGAVFQSLERSNQVYIDLIGERIVHGGLYW